MVALGPTRGNVTARVLWGTMGNDLSPPESPPILPGPWKEATLADVDGDERLDIVMTGSPSGVTGVYWHRNLGMRTWGNLQPIATQLPGTRFATANLDGDLMADFFVAVDASAGAALRVLSTAAR